MEMPIKSYRLPQKTLDKIEELAERSGGTLGVSDIVRLALAAGLPQIEQKLLPAVDIEEKRAA